MGVDTCCPILFALVLLLHQHKENIKNNKKIEVAFCVALGPVQENILKL